MFDLVFLGGNQSRFWFGREGLLFHKTNHPIMNTLTTRAAILRRGREQPLRRPS
jgi:hypothetical protein